MLCINETWSICSFGYIIYIEPMILLQYSLGLHLPIEYNHFISVYNTSKFNFTETYLQGSLLEGYLV